jgi:hypothetical protein
MDEKSGERRDRKQPPVSAGNPGFPHGHHKPEQDGTAGKRDEPLDPQDTRECAGVDTIPPAGALPGCSGAGCEARPGLFCCDREGRSYRHQCPLAAVPYCSMAFMGFPRTFFFTIMVLYGDCIRFAARSGGSIENS